MELINGNFCRCSLGSTECDHRRIWSRGISVTWLPALTDGNSLITEYIIQYWKEASTTTTPTSTPPSLASEKQSLFVTGKPRPGSSSGESSFLTPTIAVSSAMKEIQVSPSVNFHVISDNLLPGTKYCLRMYGSNENGRGSSSNIVRFTTKEETPSMGPTDISVESKGSTILIIKWKSPPKETWNGVLIGYRVGYRTLRSGVSSGAEGDIDTIISKNDVDSIEKMFTFKEVAASSSLINSEEQQLILTGLSKDTTYVIIIQAFNSAGRGPFSQQVIVETSSNGNYYTLP